MGYFLCPTTKFYLRPQTWEPWTGIFFHIFSSHHFKMRFVLNGWTERLCRNDKRKTSSDGTWHFKMKKINIFIIFQGPKMYDVIISGLICIFTYVTSDCCSNMDHKREWIVQLVTTINEFAEMKTVPKRSQKILYFIWLERKSKICLRSFSNIIIC